VGEKKKPLLFRMAWKIAKSCMKGYTTLNTENVPGVPSVVVSNHCQLYGPLVVQYYIERPTTAWCTYEVTELKEVPEYAYTDFWAHKPKCTRWFYRILSYIVAPISAFIFHNADIVPVYKDMRILKTFKQSIEKLEEGRNLHIFPECPNDYNNIINEFQERFIDLAKFYYTRTKKLLSFVPMYIAPKIKTIIYGKPIEYNPENNPGEERSRICKYLADQITELAKSLPQHVVVPYINMQKKDYPLSK